MDSESGKVTTRLFSFEEADKKRPPLQAGARRKESAAGYRPQRSPPQSPGGGRRQPRHGRAANTLTETAERTWRIAESAHRSHAEKPYRKADKAEAAADKANLKALEQTVRAGNTAGLPTPIPVGSRSRPLKGIRRRKSGKRREEYRQSVRDHREGGKARRRGKQGTRQLFCPAQEGLFIAGGIAAAILLLMTCISSLLHAVSGRNIRCCILHPIRWRMRICWRRKPPTAPWRTSAGSI